MITRLGPTETSPSLMAALRSGALVARVDGAVLELAGPGAVAAVQGLLTNDVEKPGDGAFVYGALLTPKGMIVVDAWATRLGNTVRLTVPAAGREAALAICAKYVPPRLARTTDRTADTAVLRLAGPRATAMAEGAGIPLPPGANRAVRAAAAGLACEVARPAPGAPFAVQLTTAAVDAATVEARLVAAGALAAGPAALELERILAGWPALASEVDEKTIPQEVRFDEIGGVSYTKGCYTGQETVSRLHFRGHANRQLRALEFDAEPPPPADSLPITRLAREVG
ncbi:MAG: YgfZ/GcvT domain-containing protein, partial [Gemmatimonadales bacterium]